MSLTGLYAEFALFTTIRKWDSSDAALTSILSSVAALTIYVTVQLLVLPTKRWSVLKHAMCDTLRSVQKEIDVTSSSSEALNLNSSYTSRPQEVEEVGSYANRSGEVINRIPKQNKEKHKLVTKR